jgi:hypothetical protein
MALTTLAEALTQLNANLLWEGSVSKAQLFVEAGRWLLFNRPRVTSDGAATVNYDSIQTGIEAAEKFLKSMNVNRASFTRGQAIID